MRQYNIYPTLLDSFTWWKDRGGDKALGELMDKLNKKPFKGTPAMERGTAFNDVIDDLCKIPQKMAIESSNNKVAHKGFEFPLDLSLDIANRVRGSQMQKYLQARLPFGAYDVKVYGFADYVAPDRIWELKTGSYYPGKFARRWQRATYLACAQHAKKFTYLVTDFVNVYEETYEEPGRVELYEVIREFVDFIETRRDQINNPKLFGG